MRTVFSQQSLIACLAMCAFFFSGAALCQTGTASVLASPLDIQFRDFFRFPIGPRGLEISETLRRANGQLVSLKGYMVQQENLAVGHFMLTPRPVQLSEHSDGEADDLPPSTVLVYLDPKQKDWTVTYTRGLISLTGTLKSGRHEGPDGRISWVQLQLGPDAAQSVSPAEQVSYQNNLQQKH